MPRLAPSLVAEGTAQFPRAAARRSSGTTAAGAYVNTSGLSKWFTRAERYTLVTP
jgi:hypothetical protein